MPLVIFEDEHLLVINKPAGWNTHAPSPFAGEGVYDWLRHREARWAKLAIIHRLDKETSGVIVFGKTALANKSLTQQFATRAVAKKYLLLTDRNVSRKEFVVVSNIVRAGERYVSSSAGDRAETRFRVIGREGAFTQLEAEPVTGRTHQIRVHASEHGVPILGDALYGGTGAGRVFLHAQELVLQHPESGTAMTFRASYDWSQDDGSALALREAVVEPQVTNCFRVIHGASDRWPGLYVEKLGEFLLAESEAPLRDNESALIGSLMNSLGCRGAYHKLLNRDIRRTEAKDASPRHVLGETAPERFAVRENGISFELSFAEGYSVGLFLDQRDNRRRLLVNHVASDFSLFERGTAGAELLNVFAYTSGFSVAAAKAGARTTSLDLSKKYLEWGRRNFSLNGIEPAGHDFIYGDAFDWMKRLAKKGRAFDCVVLDPPTFSKSRESGTWQAEKDYGRLVEAALPLLKSNGVLFASTNSARLMPDKFIAMIHAAASHLRRAIVRQHYVPQPPDFPISREEPAYLKTAWLRVR